MHGNGDGKQLQMFETSLLVPCNCLHILKGWDGMAGQDLTSYFVILM